ncbi:peptidoglycan editing factor PgeF [Flammeovirga sp. OC4]|uniref:peptidoglycan editing factor PgeF n=1 Tax=Flammeovirga sp. OC4 TaxID=1382345 RepID=UPI0005C4B9D6|nr:peptidoglycan editing factor PgeF [Flammeovirga sp. OC4]
MSIETLVFKQFSEYKGQIDHFITTRNGGVSAPPFASLNLGNMLHDDHEAVLKNRAIVKGTLGCQRLFIADQKHTNKVYSITKDNVEQYLKMENPFPDSDGMLTNVKNIGLLTLAADCTPILLFDPIKKVIGAVHSGWKGTVLKILTKAVEQMVSDFDSEVKDIKVSFGPFIKETHYEIGKDVIIQYEDAFPNDINKILLPHPNPEKAYLNITEAQKSQCSALGILDENIEFLPFDTYKDERFFSARKASPGQTGRFGGAIVLR